MMKMASHYYGGLSGEKAWKINRPKYYGFHFYIIKFIISTSKSELGGRGKLSCGEGKGTRATGKLEAGQT